MNSYAVLASGFEHLSYPLGKIQSCDKLSFTCAKQNFMLHKLRSKTQAEMIIGSSDWISAHSSLPVGYVENYQREVFLVCAVSGNSLPPEGMDKKSRMDYCVAVIRRLSALHSEGFGCGGISPEGVEYFRKEARLKDPSTIFALSDEDRIFFEAAATLRSLLAKGYAGKKELPYLASVYLSSSPICRDGAVAYIKGRGLSCAKPHLAIAEAAMRFLGV
ncbi:MAG: hypothetical protein N3F07_02890 [Candidatus Micrarchaeota archaeon]|nr:hypothetical protein [Candidatus Micrarchaeota archaeon]